MENILAEGGLRFREDGGRPPSSRPCRPQSGRLHPRLDREPAAAQDHWGADVAGCGSGAPAEHGGVSTNR